MAQHDYSIANQGFPAFRSDLNDALAAVVSNNSGATEPSTMFAHQIWVDTAADPSVLKIRNADNDAWITIGTINQTGDTFTLTSAVSATTLNTSGAVVFNDAGADVDFRVEGDTDANLLFVDASADAVGIGTSSPAVLFHVSSTSTGTVARFRGSDANRNLDISSSTTTVNGDTYTLNATSSSGVLAFAIQSTERARITSGGYFKASDSGTYDSATGAYHEFRQTADNVGVYITATNASYANGMVYPVASRSANSAYSFFRSFSGGSDTEFLLRGDGNAYADGSWNGSGADYAEYFESATGEAIPRGTTVVLENNKVRAATADDPASSIIGVVRPKEFGKGSMVVGNLAWNMWTDKYLTDDFGVYEMEDHEVVEWEETITDEEGNTSTKPHSYESHAIPEGVTVPADATRKTHDENGKKFQHRKLNPNYDPAAEYTPREERPEWLIIGLLGQVPVLEGQPVGDRWVKMRDISETVEEWFIR